MEYRVPTTTKVEGLIADHAELLEQHGISAGLATERPAAGMEGRYYFATDTLVWSRDNGATWDNIEGGLGEAAIKDLIADDANLSEAAQAAIAASHPAPTYDDETDEVIFTI